MKIRRRIPGWLLLCLLILPMCAQALFGLPAHGLFELPVQGPFNQPTGSLFVLPVQAAELPPAAQDQVTPTAPPGQNTPQANAGAFLSAPDIQHFPRIQAFLEVHDALGSFVHGLTQDQVIVLEDGAERPVLRLEEARPGAQVVVAVNPGPSFAIRNAQAASRYDLIKDALRAWANSRAGSNIDDLSLLITGGPAASHTSDPLQWISALNSDPVDAREAVPSLDTLFRAVTLASDPTQRPGMSRAVVFITPPPEGELDQSLENLAAQAREQHIAIYVWMVASSGAFSTRSAQQLTALSQGTGGRVFTFTGEEPLPSLEEYLSPLRDVYLLEYESGATASGAHQMTVRVEAGEASVESQPGAFELDIQPPQPAFVEPPLEVRWRPPVESEEPESQDTPANQPEGETSYSGGVHTLKTVFSFPDGRKRPLVYTALLVDGVVVDENTAEPFDTFTWKLEGITASGVHRLQIQARDELGLTGSSAELPVPVAVEMPTASTMSGLQRNLPIISGLVALVAGAVLVLVLVIGGQLRPRPLRVARRRRKSDPVTQPVKVHIEAPAVRRAGWASRLQWPGRDTAPTADAYLNPLPDAESENTLPPIPIGAEGLILGSDAEAATLLLDDPSVEPVHARLMRMEDGSFRLADEGSIAGTWVNYTPVSREGARLEHGDLIHVGRIGFRFTLRKPALLRKPIIIAEPPASGLAADEAPEDKATGPEAEATGTDGNSETPGNEAPADAGETVEEQAS
jgi:hypothetical protein